jgi:hypothetical protein
MENFRKRSGFRAWSLVGAARQVFVKPEEVHSTPEKFVEAMKSNHPAIAPSMLSRCGLP